METFVLFIIIILALSLFVFAKDSHKEENKLMKEGGMRVKYKTLINNNFIDSDGSSQILVQSTNSLSEEPIFRCCK